MSFKHITCLLVILNMDLYLWIACPQNLFKDEPPNQMGLLFHYQHAEEKQTMRGLMLTEVQNFKPHNLLCLQVIGLSPGKRRSTTFAKRRNIELSNKLTTGTLPANSLQLD